jgi:hypothetical protein
LHALFDFQVVVLQAFNGHVADATAGLIEPPEVTDVAPLDGVRVVAEVIVGQLLQPGQLDVDGGGAGEIGVDGSGLGVHRGAPWLVDDATIHALDDQEAKKMMMPTASNPRLLPSNLINCSLYN